MGNFALSHTSLCASHKSYFPYLRKMKRFWRKKATPCHQYGLNEAAGVGDVTTVGNGEIVGVGVMMLVVVTLGTVALVGPIISYSTAEERDETLTVMLACTSRYWHLPGTRNCWMNTHSEPTRPPNASKNPTNSHALAARTNTMYSSFWLFETHTSSSQTAFSIVIITSRYLSHWHCVDPEKWMTEAAFDTHTSKVYYTVQLGSWCQHDVHVWQSSYWLYSQTSEGLH